MPTNPYTDRRSLLLMAASLPLTMTLGRTSYAQTWADRAFDFDALTEAARERAGQAYAAPPSLSGKLTQLTYELYRLVAFDPDRARFAEGGGDFRLHAFHPGWLFNHPVTLYEVADGRVRPMTFSAEDFLYYNKAAEFAETLGELPGVSGFRLHYPLNTAGVLDEVISFQGASYFRALGRGSAYGLSARGLAINTATRNAEEFPEFTEFFVMRPAAGDRSMTVFATLDSESVTGAYRFVITPGQDTAVDVTARLFFRKDVAHLGVAPLTSMFLYANNNRADFDDYRPEVHDSDGLMIRRTDGDRLWRSLGNPRELATSYFSETSPQGFGLHQRERVYARYEDPGADYHRRPSVDVDFVGDWGRGAVRLVEIPSDLEVNDNIVSYWVPEGEIRAGDEREYSYRLRWGMLPPGEGDNLAYVASSRSGVGGPSGVPPKDNSRKFVVDFKGGTLPHTPDEEVVAPYLGATGGKVLENTVAAFYVPETDTWRLVGDVLPDANSTVELVAYLETGERKLTETWLHQWRAE